MENTSIRRQEVRYRTFSREEMQMKLSFLGAAQNVTGSRYLVEANGQRILVDCGLYQERQYRKRNWEPFRVPPASIDVVLLTHAHLDHCGLVPKLVHDGFKGRIYATGASCELARIVMLDSAKLQEEDAEFKQKRHKREGREGPRPVAPLYTVEDAQECLPLLSPLKYKQPLAIGDDIEATFYDAGHILGASMVQLKIKGNGQARTIVFSGDIGRWNLPILRDPTVFDQADYVITESTYGDRLHEPTEHVRDALAEVINSTRKAGGNIVIPSFAIERSQEVLYHLNQLLLEDRVPHLVVFLDSPMAINVTQVFKDHPELFDEEMTELVNNHTSPFDFPGLTMARATSESKAINHIRGTVLVIAGSGMCTGGRIKHHLVNNIERPESTILFVGYQAVGTLGRTIVDGAKEVRILGQKHRVEANVVRLQGFSGHADRDEIYRWLSGLKNAPRQVFVTHGEAESAQKFSEFLKEKTGWQTSVPSFGDQVTLD